MNYPSFGSGIPNLLYRHTGVHTGSRRLVKRMGGVYLKTKEVHYEAGWKMLLSQSRKVQQPQGEKL